MATTDFEYTSKSPLREAHFLIDSRLRGDVRDTGAIPERGYQYRHGAAVVAVNGDGEHHVQLVSRCRISANLSCQHEFIPEVTTTRQTAHGNLPGTVAVAWITGYGKPYQMDPLPAACTDG